MHGHSVSHEMQRKMNISKYTHDSHHLIITYNY